VIKLIKITIVFVFLALPIYPSFASSNRHHAINMGKGLVDVIAKPLNGIFIQGPKDVKQMYRYEVWEREDESKRGLFKYKLFAIWSAPAVEIKAIIDGLVKGVSSAGQFFKEFLSIPFSD
jgi:hypothetical protein